MREPRTNAELRHAALLAEVSLRIDSARRYGLITGGPEVNVCRCIELIERAKSRGITFTDGQIDTAVRAVVESFAAP